MCRVESGRHANATESEEHVQQRLWVGPSAARVGGHKRWSLPQNALDHGIIKTLEDLPLVHSLQHCSYDSVSGNGDDCEASDPVDNGKRTLWRSV